MCEKYPDRFIPFCNTDSIAKTLAEWKNEGRISKEAFEKQKEKMQSDF